MAMYVCGPCLTKHGITADRPGNSVASACCELCGHLDGDWNAKGPLHLVTALHRPFDLRKTLEEERKMVAEQVRALSANSAIPSKDSKETP
jgi:hypothetical protein